MNSLLYYYNNVQKMAAYRQAKRMQRGVMLGENQTVTGSTTSKFVSNPMTIGTGDFSVEFYGTMYGSNSSYASLFNAASPVAGGDKTLSFYSQYYPNNGIYGVLFSPDTSGDSLGDQVLVQYQPGNDSKFLVTLTRQGTTVNVYINGELKATKEQSEVKDLGDLQLAIANSSDVGFVRVWNYALSADDVTAHYNNGDPMGYVVPKLYRQFGPDIEPVSDTFEFNIGDPYSQVMVLGRKYPFDCIYRIDFVVDEWNFLPEPIGWVGFLPINGAVSLTSNNYWNTLEKAKIGEVQSYIVKMPAVGNPLVFIYGGQNNDSVTARHLKVTINSITPIGLIAEYLPQNLMGSRKGPAVEPTAETYEFNIGSPYSQIVVSGRQYPFDCIYRVDYVVDEWDFQPSVYRLIGFYGESGASVVAGVTSWIRKSDAKIGEVQSCFIKMPNEGNPSILLYGDQDRDITTARRLKVTIKGITPVSIPSSWLDSAKQLPLSDEYMEPLFQSIGGYDMAANGAPEILYNE